jgi:D-arginine dehydrogenase
VADPPSSTGIAIVGAGFAGAATAWALGRAGLGPGLILEQESSWGAHASGRNAAIVRLAEKDAVAGALAWRSLRSLREIDRAVGALVRQVGGLTLAGAGTDAALVPAHRELRAAGTTAELLSREAARTRFAFLRHVTFDTALWCADDGVVDIHALLGFYLAEARAHGFALHTSCRVDGPLVESGRLRGVVTSRGDVRADLVVDAAGAWAGRMAGGPRPLPLQPLRRHLFVSAPVADVTPDAPLVWMDDAGLYFRPESGGLLLSPCDETPWAPGTPPTDPAAAECLAEKMARHAPGFADLSIRRSWACLRTFAPDRRPVIGPDPRLPGLFHVSGLGGFGMMCSAAVGELAAELVAGRSPAWIDPALVAPARFFSG